MTPTEIAALKRLAEAATPGKLDSVCEKGPASSANWAIYAASAVNDGIDWFVATKMKREDARFHAACDPATILSLLADNEAMRGALEFYANPEVYKEHPHGPAFDRRDLGHVALDALGKEGSET